MANSTKLSQQSKISASNKKIINSYIGRCTLAKTYAVIRNCIPGHTYYMVSDLVWDKDFPKAWPYETKDEIDTVHSIAKWMSSDPDLGRIEVVKANVTNVYFDSRYQGIKDDNVDDGMHPACYHLNRTSPATQFIAIMNTHGKDKFWVNNSNPHERDLPQLLPYETKHEKDCANKIADTYARREDTDKIGLVMVNITKTAATFNEKKRTKVVDRSILLAAAKKKKEQKNEQ